jgi:hypothetical protein
MFSLKTMGFLQEVHIERNMECILKDLLRKAKRRQDFHKMPIRGTVPGKNVS